MYAVAIRLRDEGFDDHVIAVATDMEDAQVPTTLRVADLKLASLLSSDLTDLTDVL
jgi:hypothetical protein